MLMAITAVFAWQPLDAFAASADDGFNPNANSDVYSIAVQADGKISVGGRFTWVLPDRQKSFTGKIKILKEGVSNMARLFYWLQMQRMI